MNDENNGKRFTLEDWLSLTGLSVLDCVDLLAEAASLVQEQEKENYSTQNTAQLTNIRMPDALDFVATTLAARFPHQSAAIQNVQSSTLVEYGCEATVIKQPFTDHSDTSRPRIYCPYRGSARDLLNLAHEFSHAVQSIVSPIAVASPVDREICAFIGEQALMDYVKNDQPALYASMCIVWERDNRAYLLDDAQCLRSALKSAGKTYLYRWNYPLARVAAIVLNRECNAASLWSLYTGQALSELLGNIIPYASISCNRENYLPDFPLQSVGDISTCEIYRRLGAMLLLDTDYAHGEPEKTIYEYYLSAREKLFENRIFIHFDKGKPVGYIAWEVGGYPQDRLYVTKLSAPFGDHLSLLKSLRKQFGNKVVSAMFVDRHGGQRKQVIW